MKAGRCTQPGLDSAAHTMPVCLSVLEPAELSSLLCCVVTATAPAVPSARLCRSGGLLPAVPASSPVGSGTILVPGTSMTYRATSAHIPTPLSCGRHKKHHRGCTERQRVLQLWLPHASDTQCWHHCAPRNEWSQQASKLPPLSSHPASHRTAEGNVQHSARGVGVEASLDHNAVRAGVQGDERVLPLGALLGELLEQPLVLRVGA